MQRDLFFDRFTEDHGDRRSKQADVLPRTQKNGGAEPDPDPEEREDVSSHDPESTPLNSAHLVITHGERMGFTFTHKGGKLIVSPASRLTEEDIAVIQHFKKDLLLIIWTREVWSKENNNNDLCPLSR
jgi:hypothetical protein